MRTPLRFGLFIPPIQPPGESPTLHLERNMELVQHCDRLGYDEAWIGEHHSAGWELISSPELFIAVAAERTRWIKLGTGVSSLAYHHPLILLDRMVLLDHLTRGRMMLGIGPGSLASDAIMLGYDPAETRRMAEESLEAMIALLRSDEPVDRETDWFTLHGGRLHLRPYTYPHFPISVAAVASPSGPRLAGRFGLGMLSIGANTPAGIEALDWLWGVAEEKAVEYGQTVRRSEWAIVGAIYLADSMEQAKRDMAFGLVRWRGYMGTLSSLPIDPTLDTDEAVDEMNESGFAVIGTPDMAVRHIEGLLERTGGFGAFLHVAADWADREQTLRSYELFARHVMPHFKHQLAGPQEAWAAAAALGAELKAAIAGAQRRATEQHEAERLAKAAAAGE